MDYHASAAERSCSSRINGDAHVAVIVVGRDIDLRVLGRGWRTSWAGTYRVNGGPSHN
jgi:hypothetical protein